jgi:hypothetical protein
MHCLVMASKHVNIPAIIRQEPINGLLEAFSVGYALRLQAGTTIQVSE